MPCAAPGPERIDLGGDVGRERLRQRFAEPPFLASRPASRPALRRARHRSSLASTRRRDQLLEPLVLGDLRARLLQRRAWNPPRHRLAADLADQRPAGVARVSFPRAVAGRLAALAVHFDERVDERAGAQVADPGELVEQGVAALSQFLDVFGSGHGWTSRYFCKRC